MYDDVIEKSMLYHVIFEKEIYLLDENDFQDVKNKEIIKAINKIKSKNEEVSMLSIKAEINNSSYDVMSYLATLIDYSYATSGDAVYKRLINMSQKRKMLNLLQEAIIQTKEAEEIDIVSQKTIHSMNEILNINEKEKTFLEQVVETTEKIEKNTTSKTDYSLYTGMIELDKILCGLHKEELTIIGARPGVGKTTFALQIAEHIAQNNVETAIVSLEMSEYQVIQKMLAKRTKVNSYKMRLGTLEAEELGEIGRASAELAELPIHLITKARTLQQIENIARKLSNRGKLGLLIIDYIQLIKNKGKFNSREQEVADITRTLKLLSLELNIPIIGLCQLNRNATKQEPSLADLRESGAIEQDADNVIFLYKEDEQNGNIIDITVKIAKQRAGEVGKIYMKFNKPNSEFKGVVRC